MKNNESPRESQFDVYADDLSDIDSCCLCGEEVREYDLDGYRYWTHEYTRRCDLSEEDYLRAQWALYDSDPRTFAPPEEPRPE